MTLAPTILGSGPNEMVLSLSEDAWNGDAQFTVSVDGQQIGGVQTASAAHVQGQSQEFDLRGTFGGGQRTVTVSFLNDAWGGTAATDRNLYVTGVSCDGVAAGGSLAFLTNGAQSLVVGTAPAPVAVGSGPDTLDLKVNEDAWNGDAQFTVSVDGRQIGGTLTAQAYRCAGGVQDVLVLGSFGAGPHTAAVSFINDAWGGTAAADRNLYVTGATMDGAAIGGSALTLIANGAGSFAFQGVAPVSGTLPAPTLVLAVASDSGVAGDNITRTAKPTFAGVAQAGATVGIQIDGSFVGTGQADAAGAWSYTAAVALADGAHTVTATAVEAGNTSAAAKLALTIDTSTMAPTVALAAASDSGVAGDGITSVAQPTFTGAAEAGATVSLRIDGALVGSIQADAAGTWNCTPPIALSNGNYAVTAAAVDATGNTSDTTRLALTIDGSSATPVAIPGATIVGSGPDEMVLSLSEDAWNGDAQFTVSVDGQQIGGVQTASAAHAQGQSQEFDLRGTFGGGQRTVTVSFLNDAWGGTAATDRNLYVTGVSCDGVAAGGSLAFLTNGAQSLVVGTAPAPVTVGSGPDTLDLKVNEDAWNGDAQFTVSVDGRQIGGTLTAQAYRCAGGVQDVLVLGSFGAGPHTAAVSFINDAWGGTAAADRNLYVTGATMDGAAIGGSALTLIANGAGSFAFQGVAPVSGTLPAPTLALAAASDSGVAGDNITRTAKPTFAGVAQAGATVGIQIDGSFVGTGQADAAGAWSYTAAVALADGAHTVTATAVEAGNTSAAAKLALTIDTSTMAPTVALAAASDSGVAGDGITSVAQPTFTGAAEAGATVSLRIDGALVGSIQADAAGTWNCTPAAPLAIGKHTIAAMAGDAPGNTSDTTSLTISTSLPAPTLGLTPATDSGVPGDGITNAYRPVFTGVAGPGNKVALSIDGKSLGSATANAAGLWSYTPAGTLGAGTYAITAAASDLAGHTSAMTTLPLTVDFSCYSVTIALSAASDDGVSGDWHSTVTRPIFTGVTDAGATVSLKIDGTLAGTARADASGTWNCTPAAAMAIGNHTITATATDLAGNTSSVATQWLTIDAGAPAIPQPTVAGDIVGLVLQNNQSTALAAREITFGEQFAAGQVRPGDGLAARIDGVPYPVQMDVKTTNADGSVATAVLTMQQPALAAGTSTGVMLTHAAASSAPSIDLSTLTPAAYRCTVDLSLHNTDGTTTPVHIDAAAALASALTSGTVGSWLAGPQATQARVDVPVSGSLRVTLDITAYADGTTSTDVQFNNDRAMTPNGGTVTYDATITQNNAVAFSQSNITQYQYQTWHRQVWSNGTPQVNVQHDVLALERTGLIQAYDQTTGIAASLINGEATAMTGAGFGILGNAQITQYMPMTGGRGDIGPTTLGNAAWLVTQNQTAARYALAQADAAGSIPWHLYDPKNGVYVRVTDYPLLWPDGRAVGNGEIDLTQSLPPSEQTGWWPDPTHGPDLDYIPYLMTGSRYYLDQLNAEADFDVVSTWPAIRQGAQGLVAFSDTQARTQAWSIREVAEAAAANPDGSAEKTYFATILNNNINFLLSEAAAAHQGQSSGWIPSGGGVGRIQPWQQDFFATTAALAAEQDVPGAKQLLEWETNFLAGRFLAAAQGFDPAYGIAYYLEMFDPSVGQSSPYQTWAQIAQLTQATAGPPSPPGNWDGAYSAGARAALAGDITVTTSPDAIDAYGIVVANSPGAGIAYQQGFPGFDIVPRLPDGQLLTSDHVIVSADTITRVIHGSDADQLIYETGSGNVTIIGGAGINLLYAGSGNDTLVGGPNRDYLFGGSGSDSFSAAAGSNYLEAGSGAAVFVLAASDAAQDLIADFKPVIDRLVVTDPTGVHASATEIGSYIAGATGDSSGAAVLHLSANHDVTLQGIALGQLSASLFA